MKTTRRARLFLEALEARIAPASVLPFIDVDGDKVRVIASAGDLAGKATFANVGRGQQLQLLDLTDPSFQGANITTTVTRSPTGDGLVNIGRIDSSGRDLGNVSINGDIGDIDVGDGVSATSACSALTVQSLGLYGTATGATDLLSNFDGRLGKLTVKFDVKDVSISVIDSGGTNGKIGSVFIGGSLIGGAADGSGSITARDGFGLATVQGDIVGGAGTTSGAIACTHDL